MYNILDHSDHNAGIKEYVVDTYAEVETLPGDMGSTALCLENKKIYIKDGKGNWREFA